MDNEKEILDAEINEKETVDGEVVDNEELEPNNGFDPNVVLGAIMQNQDAELRNVVTKLSTLNMTTKATIVCLLFKIVNYLGIALLLYSLYSAIYILIHYNKVKDNEFMIKYLLSKGNEAFSIKKTVWKNIAILLGCIPLAVLSIWYWYFFAI